MTLNVPTSTSRLPLGSAFRLTIANTTAAAALAMSIVSPFPSAGNFSRVELNSLSVINVNSVEHYYGCLFRRSSLTTAFNRGGTVVYVRSVVSDPFGSFDISGRKHHDSRSELDDGRQQRRDDSSCRFGRCDSHISNTRLLFRERSRRRVDDTRDCARRHGEHRDDLGIGAFNVVVPALRFRKTPR